jgi:hypothetical protein
MKGVEPMKDLVKDFSDGVKLIQVSIPYPFCGVQADYQLLVSASIALFGSADIYQEIMSETSLGRYNKRPIMRVQKAEVSLAVLT